VTDQSEYWLNSRAELDKDPLDPLDLLDPIGRDAPCGFVS
jgi:hypothetical protein